MATPNFLTQAAAAGDFPAFQFNKREQKLLASVQAYLSGIAPSHVVKYAGKFTTVGGDASETITVTGALATDIAIVTVQTAGGTPRSIVAAIPASNAINVTMSGDPSTTHILSYVVLRAAP